MFIQLDEFGFAQAPIPILCIMKELAPPLVAFCVLLSASPVFAAVTDGLVSYWPLDVLDGGNTTADLSFGNTLTIGSNTAPTVVSGQFSNAFSFNGSSTFLTNFHSYDSRDGGLPLY